jgi:hypothetical protein
MAGLWLRLYAEIRHDRKLRRLPPAQRWLWVAIMTIAKESPRPGWLLYSEDVPVTVDDLVDEAAVSREDVEAGIRAFVQQTMLEEVDGVWHCINWDKRNFTSDCSTERVQRHRARQKSSINNETLQKRYSNDTETPPETEIRDQRSEINNIPKCYTNNQSDRERENAASRDHHRAFPDVVVLDNMPPITPETWQKLENIKIQPKDKQLSTLVIEYSQRYPGQAKQWGTRGRIAARKHFEEVISQGIEPHDILVEILFHQPDNPDEPEPKPWKLTAGLLECRGLEQTPAQVLYSMLKFDREVGINGAPRDPPAN